MYEAWTPEMVESESPFKCFMENNVHLVGQRGGGNPGARPAFGLEEDATTVARRNACPLASEGALAA